MLISIICLLFLSCSYLYCIFALNVKKYWRLHILCVGILSGISFTLWICFTNYNWQKNDFNIISIGLFFSANIELIIVFISWVFLKIKLIKTKQVSFDTDSNNLSIVVETLDKQHAFLICAHNSSGNIEETIVSIKQFINCDNIYIADNGSTIEEKLKTKRVCHLHDVNYIEIDIGNKTIAQLIGCYILTVNGYKFVTICDDDLILTNWDKDEIFKHFYDLHVKCVAYTVLPTKQEVIINKFQRIEYALSSYMRLLQGKLSSCFFASGAISTWDLNIIIEVLLRHNAEFKGDDMRCGMILHSLQDQKYLTQNKIHNLPYKIKVSDLIVYTKVPICCIHLYENLKITSRCSCGEPSLYHQRVKSWDLSRYCFFVNYTHGIFNTKQWSTRLSYIMCILSIIIDILTLSAITLSIYMAIYKPFYTALLVLQMTTFNILSMITCWWFILRKTYKISLKWCIVIPFTYYLPNLLYIKLPALIYSFTYLFIRYPKIALHKRTVEWTKYIYKYKKM